MTVEIISWSISTKVWYRAGIKLATPGSAVRHASVARHVTDCATRPGTLNMSLNVHNRWENLPTEWFSPVVSLVIIHLLGVDFPKCLTWWFLRFPFCANAVLQSSHVNSFSPACTFTLICHFMSTLDGKIFPKNVFPPVYVLKLFRLFDLILYIPSTIFQLNRDGSSWVEPVLS